MNKINIIGFLEESFGAYQGKAKYNNWCWNEKEIDWAIAELVNYQLLRLDDEGYFHATPMGKIAGESGIEMESIIRIITTLNDIPSDLLSDPTLLGITQLTKELEQVYMPINRKSIYKEPQTWNSALQRQQIPTQLINAFSKFSKDNFEATSKSKKTISCLLWITNMQLVDIEAHLMQHSRDNSAAGAIRSVASRVCDLLPIVSSIAEIIKTDIQLTERISKLLVRLELGVSSTIKDLAEVLGKTLNRGEYIELLKIGINNTDQFISVDEHVLLNFLSFDKVQEAKFKIRKVLAEKSIDGSALPDIPLYEE